jgi:hypothetical protein
VPPPRGVLAETGRLARCYHARFGGRGAHGSICAGLALVVLIQDRRWVGSALLAAVFVIGPKWFAPRGQFLELRRNWWQAAACVS